MTDFEEEQKEKKEEEHRRTLQLLLFCSLLCSMRHALMAKITNAGFEAFDDVKSQPSSHFRIITRP
jgi:hypothetical protein